MLILLYGMKDYASILRRAKYELPTPCDKVNTDSMNVIRHAGYMEVAAPEFFNLIHNPDKLTLGFSSLQSGHEKLLLDLCHSSAPPGGQEHDQILRLSQSLLHALESMRDNIEMLAVIASKENLSALAPYVEQLEANGYETRLFSDRQKALIWLGA